MLRAAPDEVLQVSVVGQLVGGTGIDFSMPERGAAHCLWRLVTEPGWKHISGALAGASQSDHPAEEAKMYVWQHPIDSMFECDGAAAQGGWPRLELEVRWRDSFDRSDLAGYGVIAVPSALGNHQLQCQLWRPRASLGESFTQFFLGGRPQLKTNSLVYGITEETENGITQLARATGDHRLVTDPAGMVHVSLAVSVRRREKNREES